MYRGVGMYPTKADGSPNPCFDSSRPDWMPYWWDDSAESACYYGTDSLTGQMVGVVTKPVGQAVGSAVANLAAGFGNGINPSDSSMGTIFIGLGLGLGAALLLDVLLHR